MTRRCVAGLALLAMLVAACGSNAPAASGEAPGGTIDPSNFVATIDNPFLPFQPGMSWVYEGVRDGATLRDELTVTDRTKTILGVPCVVVTDVAMHEGQLVEKTEDWYAQDAAGNVWYFGEATATYDAQGNVDSTEGSWEAGVDGAVAGIVMPASPKVTDSFRQEFYAGQAEDMFWIVSVSAKVDVPFGSYTDVIQTFEWTPLEPDVVDTKYYAKGIGNISENAVAGGEEHIELTDFSVP